MKLLKATFKVLLLAFLLLQGYYFTQVFVWRWVNPETTAFERREQLRLCGYQALWDCPIKREWVNFQKISPQLRKAVMISEDSDFYRHPGFEYRAMQEAWIRNQQQGKKDSRYLRGGSTITQQLAKNLFLSSDKNYLRKGQEFLITLMLELLWSKDRIFEVYLNHVEWGEGVFGVGAAARHYFGMTPAQLTLEQSARLAAALPAPKCFDQSSYCAKARVNFPARVDFILQRMGPKPDIDLQDPLEGVAIEDED